MDDDPHLFRRFAAARVTAALRDTPAVMVVGPRQCGKTTLVRDVVGGNRAYLTLDDDTTLAAAREDPAGFVRYLDRVTIDEVQRAPELLRAIKRSIDDDRRPGRFLLTASANVLTLPTVTESLAGRLAVVTLLTMSRGEIRGRRPAFLPKTFAGSLLESPESMVGDALVDAVLTGGYPEMLRRRTAERRRAWAHDYIAAIVHRDVRDIADVERHDQMRRLLHVLAHHAGQLTNFTQIGGRNALDDKTTKKYVAILEQLFLVRRVEPWSRHRLKRLVKTPRLQFLDSGLLAAILGVTPERVSRDRRLFGAVLETFVFAEILNRAPGRRRNIRFPTIATKIRTRSTSSSRTKPMCWLGSRSRQRPRSTEATSRDCESWPSPRVMHSGAASFSTTENRRFPSAIGCLPRPSRVSGDDPH